MQIMIMTRKAFDNMLLKEARNNSDNYRLVSILVLGLEAEGMPKEFELVHHQCLKSRLD